MSKQHTLRDYPSKKERRRAKKQQESRTGFYVHLMVYLFANSPSFLALLRLEGDRHISSLPFFWGIGLFFHFLKVYGSSASQRKSSGTLPAGGKAMDSIDSGEEFELRPPQKSWSEKDLV